MDKYVKAVRKYRKEAWDWAMKKAKGNQELAYKFYLKYPDSKEFKQSK